jgi:transcriptional regulator with XRE-family HTH domain
MTKPSADEIYKEIGSRLAAARKRKNLSQAVLAYESGIDRSHVGFIEQGHRKPTIATINRLTQSLDMSLEELFKGL